MLQYLISTSFNQFRQTKKRFLGFRYMYTSFSQIMFLHPLSEDVEHLHLKKPRWILAGCQSPGYYIIIRTTCGIVVGLMKILRVLAIIQQPVCFVRSRQSLVYISLFRVICKERGVIQLVRPGWIYSRGKSLKFDSRNCEFVLPLKSWKGEYQMNSGIIYSTGSTLTFTQPHSQQSR